jgi:hypothetical protein
MSSFIALHSGDDVLGPVEWVVPANQTWRVLHGHVELNTSATGGNRFVRLEILDDEGEPFSESHAGAKQGSSRLVHYNFRAGMQRETAIINDEIELGIPDLLILTPGFTLRVRDFDEIDLANDLWHVHFRIERWAGSGYASQRGNM